MGDGHVFISYGSADRGWVETLARNLRTHGHDVWLDRWKLAPGTSFIRALQEGLDGARAGVLVVTPESRASGWVQDEYETMLRRKHATPGFRIVPVLLGDGCDFPFLGNLEGWQRLTGDARDNALDRAIVYGTIGRDRFTAADALALAARAGDAVGAEDVRRALARLELAFVLGRDGSAYSYRVPLFRTAFADQAVYLDKELEDLRRLVQARPTRPAGG